MKYEITYEQLEQLEQLKKRFVECKSEIYNLGTNEMSDTRKSFELGKLYQTMAECTGELFKLKLEITQKPINHPTDVI